MNLSGKKTILISIPPGSNKVQKYCFPRYLPLFFILFSVSAIAGLSFFSYTTHNELRALRKKEADAAKLRQQICQADVQIYAFADKIRLLEKEMVKLRQYDQKLKVMAQNTPLADSGVFNGVGGFNIGGDAPRDNLKRNTRELVRQMHRDLDRLLMESGVREVRQHQIGKAMEDSRSIMASTPVDWPTAGNVTSTFGYRKSPFSGVRSEFHRGLDIAGPTGTPVMAPADGDVVSVEWNSGYGLIMTINHGYGMVTRYGHLSEAFAEAGEKVRRGEKIAAMGSSGRVTGPHLHYEVIYNGIPVNPMRYIAQKD